MYFLRVSSLKVQFSVYLGVLVDQGFTQKSQKFFELEF